MNKFVIGSIILQVEAENILFAIVNVQAYAPVMAKILDEFDLPKDLIFLPWRVRFQNTAKSWAKAGWPMAVYAIPGESLGLKN